MLTKLLSHRKERTLKIQREESKDRPPKICHKKALTHHTITSLTEGATDEDSDSPGQIDEHPDG